MWRFLHPVEEPTSASSRMRRRLAVLKRRTRGAGVTGARSHFPAAATYVMEPEALRAEATGLRAQLDAIKELLQKEMMRRPE
jgi:hypothetical protein